LKQGACSSFIRAVGRVETCYPSTWKYFSITSCASRASGNSSSEVSSTNATLAPAPESSSTNVESRAKRKGIVAGSLVAAASVTALVMMGFWILSKRRRKSDQASALELSNDHALVEMPNDHALIEASAAEKLRPEELWGGHAAVEIGRNSYYELPLEALPEKLEKKDEKSGQPNTSRWSQCINSLIEENLA
jgi:hypothetical protein